VLVIQINVNLYNMHGERLKKKVLYVVCAACIITSVYKKFLGVFVYMRHTFVHRFQIASQFWLIQAASSCKLIVVPITQLSSVPDFGAQNVTAPLRMRTETVVLQNCF